MRRLFLPALLASALLLAGCSAEGQIEKQAFAVSLAVDVGAEGGVALSARYPSYGASGKDEKSGYLLTSAAGASFEEALYALNAAIPRALNLTQVKCLIVSEKVASSEDFFLLLRAFMLSRLDAEANLIVSQGEARSLLEAQQPLIGLRLSDALETELDRCRQLGVTPRSTLAGVFFDAASIYSDPVAILAAVLPEDAALRAEPPAGQVSAEGLAYEGRNRDAYFGTALFRDGVMVGFLSGGETQLLQLIRDGAARMPMAVGDAWLSVSRRSLPRVRVETAVPRVTVSLTVGVEDLRGDADEEAVRQALTEKLDALTRRCQALRTEPFGYARRAAAACLTLEEWKRCDWRETFAAAEVVYQLRVEKINQ